MSVRSMRRRLPSSAITGSAATVLYGKLSSTLRRCAASSSEVRKVVFSNTICTRSPSRSKRTTWSAPLAPRSSPTGFEPKPLARLTQNSARVASRGSSAYSLPCFVSRYSGMKPSRRSKPVVRAPIVVAGGGGAAGVWASLPSAGAASRTSRMRERREIGVMEYAG